MNHQIYSILFLLAVFVPIVIFSVVGIAANSNRNTDLQKSSGEMDEFLLSSREATQGDYINSSVGYMLQITTTVWFVYWGYKYGLSNIIHVFTWGLGIYLFSRFAENLLTNRNKNETLPALISNGTYGVTRKIAALATVMAFFGIYYVEAYYAANFVAIMTNPTSAGIQPNYWWLYFLVLIFSTLLYSLSGGYRKVLSNDTWQLAFAYAGFALVFAYLLPKAAFQNAQTALFLATAISTIYAYLFRSSLFDSDGKIKVFSLAISLALIIGSAVIAFSSTPDAAWSADFSMPGFFTQANERFGFVTILGFSIVNILFQFCDNSNYQRIAALKITGLSIQDQRALVRSALRSIVIVSPLTWGIGIILGMLIRASGIITPIESTEYAALLAFLKTDALSGNYFALIASLGLATAFISIMMSTADVSVLVALHALARDFRLIKSFDRYRATIIGIAIATCLIAFAYLTRHHDEIFILGVISGVNACIVVLGLPAILQLRGYQLSPLSAIMSMGFGLISIIWCTLWPPALNSNISIVLPYFSAIIFGAIGIIIGLLQPTKISIN